MWIKKILAKRSKNSNYQKKWEYKVVRLFNNPGSDPVGASKKLGGTISAEALKEQFPNIYSKNDGRKQINEFLNKVGTDGWELVLSEVIAGLPVLIFKRESRK